MVIYKITNLINGKVYIGQTVRDFEIRKQEHLKNAYSNKLDTHLYNAMRKYGQQNFNFEIIRNTDNLEELNYLESYYIVQYNSVQCGYNMSYGGDNNVMFCDKTIEKHNVKMRTTETRKKISDSMKLYRKQHPFTKSHREKLSIKAMGNHNFGNGDTRSIACYCIDDRNKEHHFHSYKDAGKWWFEKYNPFNASYSQCTFQRKIQQCIRDGYCTYTSSKGHIKSIVNNVKWFNE